MADCTEVLFVSDDSGLNQSANCVDPHIGTTLMNFKSGGGIPHNTLCFVGNDYVMSANKAKPMLNIWQLNSSEPVSNLRMVVGGKVSAMAVSPDGVYAVAGIDGKIYVWMICSGSLLNVVAKHYQKINKIVFFSDSSHFVSCGEDGLVLVWKLADVVQKHTGGVFRDVVGSKDPVYQFSHHSLPVTDMYLGHGNLHSRLFTVSVDQTCKVHSMADGSLLLSIIFDFVLTSVVANSLETALFIGTRCGKLIQFGLDQYPRTLDYHTRETDTEKVFVGHSKSVTCLSASIDGFTLVSGSDDAKVIVWDIPSRQQLRAFDMKGPVTNLQFRPAALNLFTNDFVPLLQVSNFERVSSNDLELAISIRNSLVPISYSNDFNTIPSSVIKKKVSEDEISSLKSEIETLKSSNKELYKFAMEKILSNPMAVGMCNGNSTHL